MASSREDFETENLSRSSKAGSESSEPTATDIGISVPEYFQEVQATLHAAETASQAGDLAAAVTHAQEGLAMLKVRLPKVGQVEVPPHYAAFFQCHCIRKQFQVAL